MSIINDASKVATKIEDTRQIVGGRSSDPLPHVEKDGRMTLLVNVKRVLIVTAAGVEQTGESANRMLVVGLPYLLLTDDQGLTSLRLPTLDRPEATTIYELADHFNDLARCES